MKELVKSTAQVGRDPVGDIHFSRPESGPGNPTRIEQGNNFRVHKTFTSCDVPLDDGTSKIAATARTMNQRSERILRVLHAGDPVLDSVSPNQSCLGGRSMNSNGTRGMHPIVYVLAGSNTIEAAEQRRALATSPITVTTSSCSPDDIFSQSAKSSAEDTIMQIAGLTSFTPMLPKKRQRVESQ